MNKLYDFYFSLLTEKQRLFTELYYHDDLSLGEIAEQYDVSRQAVFEHLKRAEQLLEHYESQLGIARRQEQYDALVSELSTLLCEEEIDRNRAGQLVERLKNVD
jgi:uncharacterized protein